MHPSTADPLFRSLPAVLLLLLLSAQDPRENEVMAARPFAAATLGAAAAALMLAFTAPARADIVVGMTSGFTGAVAAGVKENHEGAKLWIDHVNATGGVHGQKLLLTTLDDKFLPKLAAENARKLLTEHNAIALFMNRGTPHTEAIRPLLDEFKVPLVAPSTGAAVLHQPVNPWIFNVRATYQREAEKVVAHLASIGLTRIAIAQTDDSFGADCVVGAQKGFEKARLEPLYHLKLNREKPDFSEIAQRAAKEQAQAVLMFASSNTVAEGTKAIRAAGSKAQIVTVSNNASGGFIKLMGPHARGTIVTQVFPYERSLAAPMVKEAHDLAVAKGMPGVTPAMLEGYAGAKVLVEGLKRAGSNPTRQKLRDALEAMNKVNIGGLEVSFSPSDHSGLDYADLSIIGIDGKFRR
jgi:branched-chain amino acid transport system substrate-binding protein